MLRRKKNSYKEFDNEKKFPRLENSDEAPRSTRENISGPQGTLLFQID